MRYFFRIGEALEKYKIHPVRTGEVQGTVFKNSHTTDSLLTFGLVTYNYRTIYMDMYLVKGNNLPHVAF